MKMWMSRITRPCPGRIWSGSRRSRLRRTGRTEADRAEAMQQAGAVGYLSKGGPSDELVAATRELS